MSNKFMTASQKSLVEQHLHLVSKTLKHLSISNRSIPEMNMDELYQIGCLALCKAAMSCDDGRPFAPYAAIAIRNALLDQYRSMMRHYDHFTSMEDNYDASEDGTSGQHFCSSMNEPEQEIIKNDTSAYLKQLQNDSSGVIKKGIAILWLTENGYNSTDIGHYYGVPANHIRAWKSKAVAKLRNDERLHAMLN